MVDLVESKVWRSVDSTVAPTVGARGEISTTMFLIGTSADGRRREIQMVEIGTNVGAVGARVGIGEMNELDETSAARIEEGAGTTTVNMLIGGAITGSATTTGEGIVGSDTPMSAGVDRDLEPVVSACLPVTPNSSKLHHVLSQFTCIHQCHVLQTKPNSVDRQALYLNPRHCSR